MILSFSSHFLMEDSLNTCQVVFYYLIDNETQPNFIEVISHDPNRDRSYSGTTDFLQLLFAGALLVLFRSYKQGIEFPGRIEHGKDFSFRGLQPTPWEYHKLILV